MFAYKEAIGNANHARSYLISKSNVYLEQTSNRYRCAPVCVYYYAVPKNVFDCRKKFTSKDSRKMLLIQLSRLRQISLRRRNAVTTILLRLRSKDTILQLDPFRSASLLSASFPNPARISSCERTHVVARNWKVNFLCRGACPDLCRNRKKISDHTEQTFNTFRICSRSV